MKLNIRTEKKHIWLLGYCFILLSINEVFTYNFLITAGIVAGNEITANPLIHYGGTILISIFVCLLLVRTYEIVPEERRVHLIVIGILAVSVMMLFCIINLWRLFVCMW